MDIPRLLITQLRSTRGKAEMFSSAGRTRTDNTSVRVERATNWATRVLPEDHVTPGPQQGDLLPTGGIVGQEQPRHEKAIPMGPVGGIPSHLGHKTLGKKVCYCQSLPSNVVLLGASYSVYWWVGLQSLQDIPDGVKFILSHRCSILISHPFDCCKRG